MKQHKARHLEIRFDKPEPFALVVQTTQDGERITKEQQQAQADKREQDKQQLALV